MLAEYAAYLKAGRLEAVAAEHLARWRKLDLTLTRLFTDVPDDVLLPRFVEATRTFCDDMIAGRRFWRLRELIKLWEEDRLPDIPKDSIEPSDLVLANLAQREALLAFVPGFTTDVETALAIVDDLNALIQAAKVDAFTIFVRQREDLRTATTALATEVREHQEAELKLSQQALRMHVLAELSAEMVRSAKDAGAFTAILARRVAELMDASVLIHLVAEDGEHLRLVAEHGADPVGHPRLAAHMAGWDLPLADHPLAPYEAPLLIPDLAHAPPRYERMAASRPEGRVALQSYLGVPLRSSDALLGTLGVLRLAGAAPLDEEDLAFVQDLGDRTALALENARLYTEMERRVADRTRDLEQLNQELEAFSYSVSHDLRGPLRGIDGFSQALLEDYGGQLDATGKDYLERVRAATRRMGELIDAMLEMSRIARAPLRRQAVDLSSMAEAVLGELRNGEARQVRLAIQPGLRAEGDPRLLRVVLENLLNNAWKYSGKREVAEIGFQASQVQGELVYEVRDNGAGFDMAYAGKLFRPFARLHGQRDFAGSGVGLATVQRIVARHGGRIWGEGKPGEGAVFRFTLPCSGSPGGQP